MSAAAGPSSAKKSSSKKSSKSTRAVSVESDAESVRSVDSDAIDEDVLPVGTPAPKEKSGEKKRKGGISRYQAPEGMEPVSAAVTFKSSPFEFDTLASKPGVQLWAIRMPADLKTSRLSGLNVSVAGNGERVTGALSTKGQGGFKLLPASKGKKAAGKEDDAEDDEGAGAEMTGLSLLVPQMMRGGKLVRAPVSVTRTLLLTPTDSATPTPASEAWVPPPKTKRAQPTNLKFRNRAFGFDTAGPAATVVAEGAVDVEVEAAVDAVVKPLLEVPGEKKEERRKKRKSDVDGTPSKKKRKE